MKKISFVFLFLIAVLFATGCYKESGNSNSSTAIRSSSSSDGSHVPSKSELIALLEELRKNVKLFNIKQASYGFALSHGGDKNIVDEVLYAKYHSKVLSSFSEFTRSYRTSNIKCERQYGLLDVEMAIFLNYLRPGCNSNHLGSITASVAAMSVIKKIDEIEKAINDYCIPSEVSPSVKAQISTNKDNEPKNISQTNNTGTVNYRVSSSEYTQEKVLKKNADKNSGSAITGDMVEKAYREYQDAIKSNASVAEIYSKRDAYNNAKKSLKLTDF